MIGKKLPVVFGYAGILPFFLIMIMALLVDEPELAKVISFLQMTYATMILSFLGGIHWGQAIPSDNQKQLAFSMVPTIACFGLMIWVVLVDPFLPILGAIVLFWLVFYADKKLMPLEYIPENYFSFRLRLTTIVTVVLASTFFGLI